MITEFEWGVRSVSRSTSKKSPAAGALQPHSTIRAKEIERVLLPFGQSSKTYSDGTPATTFNYDQTSALGVTLTNTIGRRSSESTAGSLPTGAVFSYDSMGRVANNSQCTPQNCGTGVFAFQYTQYDFLGDLTSGTNAGGVTLTYSYNRAARLTSITTNLVDPGHPGTLFTSAHYAPFGALTSTTLGNSLNESFSYDNRMRLKSYAATSGTTTPFSFNITTFAPNGDILAASDSVNGNWSYGYDAFNRLTSANATGQAYTYDYDRFGNRWHQNGPHSMQLSFSGANNRMDGYSYDAAGNLLNDGSHNYFYDGENRLIQIDGTLGNCSTGTACYVYDAEGRRVRKTKATGTLDFLYDKDGNKVAEVNSTGAFQRGELYAGGRHFAVYAPDPGPTGSTFFIHADWLGTERARTSMTGTACETIVSLPFGDGQTISDSCGDSAGDVSPMHFTGKERDTETGLDNFRARYDSSQYGRFMSPDPIGIIKQKLTDPQQWNMYSYARNNPLRFMDPTGKAAELTGEDNERRRKLEALQAAVGPLASSYLYDNVDEKTGKHYLGIRTGGPSGKGPAFNSINAVANKLGGIVNDTRVATIQFVDPGTRILNSTIGAGPELTPGTSTSTPTSARIYLTSGDVGSTPGFLFESGEETPTNLSVVLMHELGHVDAAWYHGGPALGQPGNPINGNGDAVRIENQVRQMQGLPLRNGEYSANDVPLLNMPY